MCVWGNNIFAGAKNSTGQPTYYHIMVPWYLIENLTINAVLLDLRLNGATLRAIILELQINKNHSHHYLGSTNNDQNDSTMSKRVNNVRY